MKSNTKRDEENGEKEVVEIKKYEVRVRDSEKRKGNKREDSKGQDSTLQRRRVRSMTKIMEHDKISKQNVKYKT